MRDDDWPPPSRTLHEWEHAGLRCAVCKTAVALCGYVMVPESHPYHGKGYDNVDVRVHGGLTFADGFHSGWWFGFDCAHSGDVISMEIPLFEESEESKIAKRLRAIGAPGIPGWAGRGEVLWGIEDVVKETCLMAEQLAAATRARTRPGIASSATSRSRPGRPRTLS